MALVDFNKVKQLFGDSGQPSDADLFRELFVLVLSRSTDADSYSHPAEVASVQAVIKEELGEDMSAGDIRTAAASKIYESTPLRKMLAGAAPKLTVDQRRAIVQGLVTVMHADEVVSSREYDFFNMVVDALDMTPADVAGLVVA